MLENVCENPLDEKEHLPSKILQVRILILDITLNVQKLNLLVRKAEC